MKKTLIRILWVMAIALVAIPAYSQSQEDMKENMKKRAKEKTALLGRYITNIAKKYEDLTPKEQENKKIYYIEQALKLFIAKGEKYDVITTTKLDNGREKTDTIHKEGVMMEVTSISRPNSTSRKTVKKYLPGLKKLTYSQVEIKTTDATDMRVTNPKKIGDNTYHCTCYFEQEFIGKTGEVIKYGDRTTKRVDIITQVLETEDGTEFKTLLGDVTAVETKRL